MNNQIENNLKKLFGAFGRKPLRQQFDVYMEWADNNSEDIVEKVVKYSINNEERLPTISKLLTLAKSLSPKINYSSINGIDDCWFCDGTGQIPALYEPNKVSSVYHIRMFACKCSKGERIGIPEYFSKYDNLQFEEEAKEYPHINYFQVVYFIRNQKNKQKNEMAEI